MTRRQLWVLLGWEINEIFYSKVGIFLTCRHVLDIPTDDSTPYWPERTHSIKPPETRINNTESGEFSWGGEFLPEL